MRCALLLQSHLRLSLQRKPLLTRRRANLRLSLPPRPPALCTQRRQLEGLGARRKCCLAHASGRRSFSTLARATSRICSHQSRVFRCLSWVRSSACPHSSNFRWPLSTHAELAAPAASCSLAQCSEHLFLSIRNWTTAFGVAPAIGATVHRYDHLMVVSVYTGANGWRPSVLKIPTSHTALFCYSFVFQFALFCDFL